MATFARRRCRHAYALIHATHFFESIALAKSRMGRIGWEASVNCVLDVLRVVGRFWRTELSGWEIACLRDLVLTVAMSLLAHRRHAASTFIPSVSFTPSVSPAVFETRTFSPDPGDASRRSRAVCRATKIRYRCGAAHMARALGDTVKRRMPSPAYYGMADLARASPLYPAHIPLPDLFWRGRSGRTNFVGELNGHSDSIAWRTLEILD